MAVLEIGCCGAYCKTCIVFKAKNCKGCKLGYSDGMRDITKAKCKIKRCCMHENYSSCADCNKYDDCLILREFFDHSPYKYKKYKQALEFIRENGYEGFLQKSDSWMNAYGKL